MFLPQHTLASVNHIGNIRGVSLEKGSGRGEGCRTEPFGDKCFGKHILSSKINVYVLLIDSENILKGLLIL